MFPSSGEGREARAVWIPLELTSVTVAEVSIYIYIYAYEIRFCQRKVIGKFTITIVEMNLKT
jgi:hypothetical protein